MEAQDRNELLLEDERLIREENIPGLTISSRNHEVEVFHKLHEQLDSFDTLFDTSNRDYNVDEHNENNKVKFYENALEETEIEKNIRLGEMTPFGTAVNKDVEILNNPNVKDYLLRKQKQIEQTSNKSIKTSKTQITHKNKYKKKKRVHQDFLGTKTIDVNQYPSTRTRIEPVLSEKITIDFENSSGSEYVPSDEETEESDSDYSDSHDDKPRKKSIRRQANKNSSKNLNSDTDTTKSKRIEIKKVTDDGNEFTYEKRLKEYEKLCQQDDMLFHEIEDCSYFNIPLEVWSKLYTYQKVGVQWLWELHQQGAGCILADEMGLGKTIQVIAFLSGLYHSRLKNKHTGVRGLGSCLIVCPTTLMYQWVKEFHIWLPPVRVAILHACGSFAGKKDKLIRDIQRGKGVLITSYVGMLNYSEEILKYGWNYAILDEGHKIRNPNSKVTLAVKQLKTPHRIILSGSPLQNNLEELWSLFDFIYPGKLGSLPMFQVQFSIPITHGGYANASDTEVMIAHKCATALKELISPYLLRRSKIDLKSHINLPDKNEQVLFCQLTDCQRQLYRNYLDSKQVSDIFEHRAHIFVGIINLRKICNHPDLFTGKSNTHCMEAVPEEEKYGYWNKSGKMIVLETLLKIWRRQNHKVLVFTQSRKMLDILEQFIRTRNYTYMKIDGGTYIGSRQPLIDQFNSDHNYFIMLLTTKVGGLGVNLTGANRIVIFDPDWNPATDTQARERAWRIGQTQDVTIYRLISVGTIEEKMYHRQIFKQFLTNKVLSDPKQRRFFKSNDLFELFTLKETNEGSTETGAIFAGTGTEINEEILKKKQKLRKKNAVERKKNVELLNPLPPIQFSQKKIEDMKLMAKRLSQKLMQKSSKDFSPDEPTLKDNNDKTENGGPSCSRNMVQAPMPEPHLNSKCPNNDLNSASSKNKKKKRLFEGKHEVPYLIKSKKAKIQIESDEDVKTEKDEYVLKKLFSKTGMCSALQHDAIMDGSQDYVIIEKEADRIAQKAIEELKRSQNECFPASTGIPNWTGKNGIRGRGEVGVSSSSKILEKIRQRTGEKEATNSEVQLLKDLKKFITSNGGTSTTDKIIHAFQKDVPPNATPLFKSLLNKICNFRRGEDRIGYWTLKEERES